MAVHTVALAIKSFAELFQKRPYSRIPFIDAVDGYGGAHSCPGE